MPKSSTLSCCFCCVPNHFIAYRQRGGIRLSPIFFFGSRFVDRYHSRVPLNRSSTEGGMAGGTLIATISLCVYMYSQCSRDNNNLSAQVNAADYDYDYVDYDAYSMMILG